MKRILHILIVMTLVFSVGVNVYADDFDDAEVAVANAEASQMQADVDIAQPLVTALADGTVKTDLQTRLDAVQDIIDATAAVAGAELSLVQSELTAAQILINLLPVGPVRAGLQLRLNAAQEALNWVWQAEATPSQANIDIAKPLVEVLLDSPAKTVLLARLNVVQDLIDAKALKEAVESAAPGATVTVSKDINYNQNELGSIVIDKEVTLDFNKFKISVNQNLFQIISTGALTLVKAQIESDTDIIETNRGSLTVQSTYGSGITSGSDFIDDNYGSVIIKSGEFMVNSEIIEDNYASGNVIVWNGTFYMGSDFIDDNDGTVTIHNGTFGVDDELVDNNDGTVTIHNGIFNLDDEIIEHNDGTLIIHDGEFNAANELIQDNYGAVTIHNGVFNVEEEIVEYNYGTFVIHNGEFNGGTYDFVDDNNGTFTIYNGKFDIVDDFIDDNYGLLIIKDGTFIVGNRIVAYTYGFSEIFIHGGIFTGSTENLGGSENLFNLSENSITTLSGGKFTNANGNAVFNVADEAKLIIKEGHYTIPKEDWLNSSEVEVLAYKTEAAADPKPLVDKTDAQKPADGISPKTGDMTNLTLWFVLLMVFSLILIGLIIYGRERQEI